MGLRVSEAAGIWIDIESIPKDLFHMDHLDAKSLLKKNIQGDIRYSNLYEGFWVCEVVNRNNLDFRSGIKNRNAQRMIRLDKNFSEDDFTMLLFEALRERRKFIRHEIKDHGYLFVSQNHKNMGASITGSTIARKYENIIKRRLPPEEQNVFQRFSPHSFRHFYATYLIRVLQRPIYDVSRSLGHQNTEITRETYLHFLPESYQDLDESTSNDMVKTFGVHKEDIDD